MEKTEKKSNLSTSESVFIGMSVDELSETLYKIHIDPNCGLLPRVEQEIGYMAINEAVRRLRLLDATPNKCRPDGMSVNYLHPKG